MLVVIFIQMLFSLIIKFYQSSQVFAYDCKELHPFLVDWNFCAGQTTNSSKKTQSNKKALIGWHSLRFMFGFFLRPNSFVNSATNSSIASGLTKCKSRKCYI